MTSVRAAQWIIWPSLLLLALAVAVFALLVQWQMDVGSTMMSVLLLGATATTVAILLLGGSVVGTLAVARNPDARSAFALVTIVAGWTGAVLLLWLLWGFWTH